ncbi:uncharacterized protein LOC125727149 [Brienomyrus brachyistius]|uniref:uncharacterized protein LOC125727149 n=1 Tax=Brienomyrus brachyistius TaxID=42636 RepID=UPI0020B28ED0|nr:uncharacterized protein LOC125727149 [Brienomyrus brachyistius]
MHCLEIQSHLTPHAILLEKDPLSPEDCWAVLRAAKNDFLAILGKVYPEEKPLESAECCLVLYYLEATVILKHLQRPGVVEHMTVEEWMARSRTEPDHAVIGVKEHKTSAQQVATFALSSEEETWFDIYFTRVRPQLLSSKRSRMTTDDQGGDGRFFVSTAGRPIFNASNDLNRLHQKYKLDPVTSQMARRIFETATKDLSDQQKSLVADYLTHSSATADKHYRMKKSQNVVLASMLLKRLAGDLSADSAEEGSSCSAHGAARDAAIGSNQQMDVQAAFDQLLKTNPVTLDGDVPDKNVRTQTSGQFQRQLYERWLKAQMRMRVRHVLSHFGRRQPTESRVDAWIRKQGWRNNVPSAASVLKDWRPVGSVDTAIDCHHVQNLVRRQKWKGLVVVDIAGKGKGVCATRQFQAGEVVCDYHGPVVTATEGQRIHESTKEEESGYMFFFRNSQGIHKCVDAHSPECNCHPGIQTLGRLVNHSRKKANLRPRLYSTPEGQDIILLLSVRKINVGEELLFDYGVQRTSFRGEGLELSWL